MDTLPASEPFRFSPSRAESTRTDSGDLAQETRREIQRLVREASELVSASSDAKTFWPAFLDRVLRATAADAAIAWTLEEGTASLAYSVGLPIESNMSVSGHASHTRLIEEIAASTQPILVLPSSEIDLPEEAASLGEAIDEVDLPQTPEPSNPTNLLALVVPILVDGSAETVLEIFMPSGAGPATQRGYLRFAAQMGDLAGEFLRTDALRTARAAQAVWRNATQQTACLHRSLDSFECAVSIVDRATELFDVDRASLLRIDRGTVSQVEAISGVPNFDDHSPTVKSLIAYAQQRQRRSRRASWSEDEISENEGLPVVGMLPIASQDPQSNSENPDASEDEPLAILLLQRREGRLPMEQRQRLIAFADHASMAWQNAQKFNALPLADLQTRIFTLGGRLQPKSWRRRAYFAGGLFALLTLVALLPVPLIVSAPGQLVCLDRQSVYAPSDATVFEVVRKHGATVAKGDVLLRLRDDKLDREIDELVGQQSVLTQRQVELRTLMISADDQTAGEAERIDGEYKIVQQKLRGIAQQLALAEEDRQSLTVRAKRAGTVIGWNLQESLQDKPVSRGELLLQVIDPNGQWAIEADIPQTRLDHVMNLSRHADDSPEVSAAFRATASQQVPGKLESLGAVAFSESQGAATAKARVLVEASDLPIRESGAAATVSIPCGRRPLFYVAFQDLIRTLHQTLGSYTGS